MNKDRYVPVGNDVYIDEVGPQPRRWLMPLLKVVAYAVGLVTLGELAFMVFSPIIGKAQTNASRATCQSNLKQIGLALFQYVEDYDQKYPAVTVHTTYYTTTPPYYAPFGWADAIQPYIKTTEVYHCPSGPQTDTKNPSAYGFTDYWFNGNLSQRLAKQLESSPTTFLLGEGNSGLDATTARYNYRALPLQWVNDQHSPAWRHGEGANYAFTDGHVKWLKPGQVNPQAHDPNGFSF